MRNLLFIDSSFTYRRLKQGGLDHVLTVRFLDNYFDKVWSAHPLDTQPTVSDNVSPWGKATWVEISEKHKFLRGRYGRFAFLRWAKQINGAWALICFSAELVRLVRRERIKVIRVGDPLLTGLIGVAISYITGARLVLRINGNNDELRKETQSCIQPSFFRWRWVEELVEKRVISHSQVILVPNRNYEIYARNKGASSKQIHFTNYGNLIDPRHLIHPSRRPRIRYQRLFGEIPERRWVAHIGRLHEVKRVEEAYDAFVLLSRSVENVGICFVGDGPLREKLERRVSADDLSHRVRFMGNIDQETLWRSMQFFSVIVSPRTGRALAEAAFGARPIVAYDLDWQGELLESGKSGLLVPEGDSAAMAEGVLRILGDNLLAKKLGANARKRAFKLLSPQLQSAAEMWAYDQVYEKAADES